MKQSIQYFLLFPFIIISLMSSNKQMLASTDINHDIFLITPLLESLSNNFNIGRFLSYFPHNNVHNHAHVHAPVFTFSTNIFTPTKTDNASYFHTILEVDSLKASGLNYISNHYFYGNAEWKKWARIPFYWIGLGLQSTLFRSDLIIHEWGHYSRLQAAGVQASIGVGPYEANLRRYSPYFWDIAIFLSTNGIGRGGYVSFNDDLSLLSPKTKLLVAGAGLNNHSAVSDYYDEHVFLSGGGSIFQATSVFSRMGIGLYGRFDTGKGNDIDSFMETYAQESVDTPLNRLHFVNIGDSTIWSGSTWAYFIGLSRYFLWGQTTYDPLEFHSFLIPNQTVYLSSKGTTRKVTSGYRWSDSMLGLFGVEWVEVGQPFEEYTLGLFIRNLMLNRTCITVLSKWMVSSKGTLSSELTVSTPISPTWTLKGHVAWWDQNSLIGERNTLDYRNRHSLQFTLMASYHPFH